jgi:hypothetical protein
MFRDAPYLNRSVFSFLLFHLRIPTAFIYFSQFHCIIRQLISVADFGCRVNHIKVGGVVSAKPVFFKRFRSGRREGSCCGVAGLH